VKRAAAPHDQPLAKSMASASLVAFLIVSKFADGLAAAVSDRDPPAAPRNRPVPRPDVRLAGAVRRAPRGPACPDDGQGNFERHVYTDDTVLPLQNTDPERKSTVKARLIASLRCK
jgi:hypothetical protein